MVQALRGNFDQAGKYRTIGLAEHLTRRKTMFYRNIYEGNWNAWLAYILRELPQGVRGGWSWPLAYVYFLIGRLYFRLRGRARADDPTCFGWHCMAKKVR